MWTLTARAELARESLPYATCSSEAEWAVVEPLLPAPAATGRPRRWPMRAVFDGILYVLRTGCAWRHLPLEFPPWSTVHRWFLRLSHAGVFERLAHTLTTADRERAGRAASPSGAILDAQAARSGGVGVKDTRGYDPARRIVGSERHALTDIDGRLLVAAISPANLHDSHGGVTFLRASRNLWPFMAHCFADRAYRGDRVGSATAIAVEVVAPAEGQKGFAVQPRRWVIERTFGWIARCRRLARDHEATPSSALASAMILVKRLAQAL